MISIIVPVYQVAPYLRDCLDSILGQSVLDWEMLLVDDGSTDGSGEICDAYANKDSRIHVFHQENAGLSAARNTALDHAAGQYYIMVDSDDVLATPAYLQILYDALVENDADMSVCGHIWFPDGAVIPKPIGMMEGSRICSGREFYLQNGIPEKYDYSGEDGCILSAGYSPYGAHGKLYRRELFEQIRYPVGHVFEDLAIAHRVYLYSDRIVVSGAYMYAYRRRPTGILRSTPKNILVKDKLYAYHDLLSFSMEKEDMNMAKRAGRMLRRLIGRVDH